MAASATTSARSYGWVNGRHAGIEQGIRNRFLFVLESTQRLRPFAWPTWHAMSRLRSLGSVGTVRQPPTASSQAAHRAFFLYCLRLNLFEGCWFQFKPADARPATVDELQVRWTPRAAVALQAKEAARNRWFHSRTASITQTRPSGLYSTETVPLISADRPRCNSLVPKPCRVGGLTVGPPLSVHRTTSRRPGGAETTCHAISTMPVALDRLPYLAALVASSCSASASETDSRVGNETCGPWLRTRRRTAAMSP